MKWTPLIWILLLNFPFCLSAQITGKVNYEKVGIAFDIPNGWMGQEREGMLILGSQSLEGFILITSHSYSLEELKKEAQRGINEGNGSQLQLSQPITPLATNAIAGNFDGMMEWQSAKAYVIGVENPYQGPGVSITAIALSPVFSTEHQNVCNQIYKSLEFTKVDRSQELREWRNWLANARLTYMDSNYSSGYSEGSISTGYSSKTQIDLCQQGYFLFTSSSQTTVSGDGVSGYNSGGEDGDGDWEIAIGPSGDPSLFLNFQNGERYVYRLELNQDELYLEGDRFFRTTQGEYAPNCN